MFPAGDLLARVISSVGNFFEIKSLGIGHSLLPGQPDKRGVLG